MLLFVEKFSLRNLQFSVIAFVVGIFLIEGSSALVDERLKSELVNQFDNTENSVNRLINMLDDDDDDDDDVRPTSGDVVKYSYQSGTIQGLMSARKNQGDRCSISVNKLTELKNEINDALSNAGARSWDANCQFEYSNSNNCKELMRLILCGVSHIKSGFLKAVNDQSSMEKWKNAFDSLSGKYQREMDDMKKSMSERYKQQFENSKNELQTTQRLLNKITDEKEYLQKELNRVTQELHSCKRIVDEKTDQFREISKLSIKAYCEEIGTYEIPCRYCLN